MTDLEITRLCAEAIGYECRYGQTPVHTTRILANMPGSISSFEYDPLNDSYQVMRLVQRFGVFLHRNVSDLQWDAIVGKDPETPFKARDMDVARAICECVAKMQSTKQKSA